MPFLTPPTVSRHQFQDGATHAAVLPLCIEQQQRDVSRQERVPRIVQKQRSALYDHFSIYLRMFYLTTSS